MGTHPSRSSYQGGRDRATRTRTHKHRSGAHAPIDLFHPGVSIFVRWFFWFRWSMQLVAVLSRTLCALSRPLQYPHLDPRGLASSAPTPSRASNVSGGSVGASERRSSLPVASAGFSDNLTGFVESLSSGCLRETLHALALFADSLPWCRVTLVIS
jgi:hypothetical protein